jgi:hypothetical protein
VHATSTSSPTASGGAEEEEDAARGEAAAAVDGARNHRTNGLTLELGRVKAPAPWSARDARATTCAGAAWADAIACIAALARRASAGRMHALNLWEDEKRVASSELAVVFSPVFASVSIYAIRS